jgi:hypothetical protein
MKISQRVHASTSGTRPAQSRRGPWSKRGTAAVLLLCSMAFVAAGVPILLFGGVWMVPGLILTVTGAAGMGYAFLFFVEASDE